VPVRVWPPAPRTPNLSTELFYKRFNMPSTAEDATFETLQPDSFYLPLSSLVCISMMNSNLLSGSIESIKRPARESGPDVVKMLNLLGLGRQSTGSFIFVRKAEDGRSYILKIRLQ